MGREERGRAQGAFPHDPGVQVLVATDAAGGGIHLQRAHLMVNGGLPRKRSRIERLFERMCRIGRSVRFTEAHATGNDTGGKARGGILTCGQKSNCDNLAAMEEERGYPRNGHRSVCGDPFHHDAFQDLKADYIPIQSALQHGRLEQRGLPGGQAPEVWLAVTRKYATSGEEI